MSIRAFLRGIKEGMQLFGHNVALIVNVVILTLVYFVGVGFTALAAKLAKKQFLKLRTSKQSTYWSDLRLSKKPIEEYYRQF